MIATLKKSMDTLLGRGDAAITVPPMDGPLKPNTLIEDAEVFARFEAPQDLAFDGEKLWVADGRRLWCQEPSGSWTTRIEYERPITAIAHLPRHGIVVAVGGTEIRALGSTDWNAGGRTVAGKPLRCVTAMTAAGGGGLIVTDSSARNAPDQWARDLIERGKSGRVCHLSASAREDCELATGMEFPFGAFVQRGKVWVSESWKHRIVTLDVANKSQPTAVVDRMPAYPSRLAPASDGGVWLSMFAARTRLVEFVLRERQYRERMMREVDPRYWVAPALSSGNSFLEPLQGGSVKQLGIMKPWAPPRSYGLVVKLDEKGLPVWSLHSRANGRNHGIVAVAEARGHLYMLSRGAGVLLRVNLKKLEDEGRHV